MNIRGLQKLIAMSAGLCLAFSAASQPAQNAEDAFRWSLSDQGRTIVWTPDTDIPHYDHLEMTGEAVSLVLRWGVDADGAFRCERSLVFPTLRKNPNDTHGSLVWRTAADIPSVLSVENMSIDRERVTEVSFDGIMRVKSLWNVGWTRSGADWKAGSSPEIEMVRTIFPSVDKKLVCESYVLRNIGSRGFSVNIPQWSTEYTTDPAKGAGGAVYSVKVDIAGHGDYYLSPGGELSFEAYFRAGRLDETLPEADFEAEYSARRSFASVDIASALILESPDSILNSAFHFAKLRACESIVLTKNGYMHAPGGEVFYAALWTNDQGEYVSPFFPFIGYDRGCESAENCYRLFGEFMNDEFRPIPSSIIAEGDDIWAGAGDRGDAAMLAYGAGRYALASGSPEVGRKLWPLVEWCIEYCQRQKTAEGVIASDTDELEGRFPAGEANLSTSCLYYDALVSAAYLSRELGRKSKTYLKEAERMKGAIESYFGAEVSGYQTYRYYDGNDRLRSWICLPLVMGIDYNVEGTVAALLGPELMTEDGVLTEQGSTVFWDRSTLYTLRGLFCAGYADEAWDFMHGFSGRRLLGDHVPYMVEAWPEGAQRHLSGESGLYCRIVTEGLFGIRPCGFSSFIMTPSMPSGWENMALRRIRAFGCDFDLSVARLGAGKLEVVVSPADGGSRRFVVREGESLVVRL